MADETLINGQFSDDRTVEITGDESSAKISGLTNKMNDLELENEKIIRENEEYKQRIEELKASLKTLTVENVEFKKRVDEAESENKMLEAVAARASELEGEVSRLQHDLVSAMSDVQESNVEISNLKKDLEGMKEREKEKDVKVEAIEKERDLLLAKVEKLVGVESSLRDESEGKEKEIRSLKKSVEDLEAVVGNNNNLEKLKHELEKTIEKLKEEISHLEINLDEKEKLISGFEMKERAVVDAVNCGINGDTFVEGEKKGLIGDLKKDWVLVGGSTVAAVALMGVVCYMHAAKKH
ncbi:hypothetical protein BUALT_Bualt03G0178900 [Buddleja alternifolia]|uniref:Peroxisomal and mitochondrial division factor 2-like n=1 Tax=Buddleja alternifolia TaxID=168488 RepID=A0AAV6XVX5_9LAMI|nr:hypothetical protein BUALT_Bualt03G0178900 [Buddleja alternifolia]